MAGVILFLLGSAVLIQQVLPKGSIARGIPTVIALCCAVAVLWGARAVNQRIVFPRGGYVEPRHYPASRFISVTFLALVVVLGILVIAWPEHQPNLESRFIVPGFAIAFAILCLAAGWKQKSTSMILFGVCLTGVAPLLWWIPGDDYERMSGLQVVMGTALAVAGAVRLRSFLRANPKPVEPTNE
jgi:hypothetical protein